MNTVLKACAFSTAVLGLAAAVHASSITLGSAGNFAVLSDLTTANATSSTTAANINANNYTINGNTGAPTITGAAPDAFNGDVYTANSSQPMGTITGTYHPTSASTINAAAADAITASNQLAALTTTQTFSSLNGQTIVGDGGVNVISVTGNISGGFQVSGGANDIFVFNVLGTLDFNSGIAGANAGGSTVTPSQIIYNFIGTTSGQVVNTMVPDTINGTLLSVNGNYNYTLDSVANGSAIDLFNGTRAMLLMSAQKQNATGNTFVGVPTVPLPPAFLGGFALLGSLGIARFVRRRAI
jgi:hypothetical protein